MADLPIPKTELQAAEWVRDGILPDGYAFHNRYLWNLRVTGTGVSWRSADKQFCYRPPKIYLNDEFLARCNGLTVIYEHPEGATLDSEEFHDRAVGACVLPYLKLDAEEVWSVASIYDDATDAILRKYPMSTSPCVDFGNNENKHIILDDGEICLVEGNPPLLDHLAICEAGVWDKQGPPSGVGNGDQSVTPEEEAAQMAADKAKKDAEEAEAKKKADAEHGGMEGLHSKLNAIMDCLGATNAKVDSAMSEIEALKKAKEDGSKKDAETAEEREALAKAERERKEKEKADAEREAREKADAEERKEVEKIKADAEAMKARLADAEEKLKEPEPEEREKLSEHQAKADAVYMQHGKQAPPPMAGEKSTAYRLRLAAGVQDFSPAWKGVKLGVLAKADSVAFANAEREIYADAETAARTPTVQVGVLQPRVTRSEAGHVVREWRGDINTWCAPPFRHKARFKSQAEIRGAV